MQTLEKRFSAENMLKTRKMNKKKQLRLSKN